MFFTKEGDLLTSMPIKNCKKRVAVSQVELVNVRVLIALPPALHAARPIHEAVVLAILGIFLRHRFC